MSRSDGDRLLDVLDAIAAIERHLLRGPVTDGLIFDAVRVRLIEIGEAVKDIDADLLAQQPQIPWRQVAAMRDQLAHRYFDISQAIVEDTVTTDLAELAAAGAGPSACGRATGLSPSRRSGEGHSGRAVVIVRSPDVTGLTALAPQRFRPRPRHPRADQHRAIAQDDASHRWYPAVIAKVIPAPAGRGKPSTVRAAPGCLAGFRSVGVLAGPFSAAAVLLAVGGAPKLARPASAAGALASLRLPSSPTLVRLLGAAEVAIAAAALLTGSRLAAALMATAYAGFAVFVAVALARPGLVPSCGCFGRPDTPPTAAHLVVNLAAAAVAAAVAVIGGGRLDVASQPLLGLPLVLLTAACAWFGYLALALLPRTSAKAYRA